MLYFHHPSSLEHDPRVMFPEHPDSPELIAAIESALELAGWPVQAPAAEIAELELVMRRLLGSFVGCAWVAAVSSTPIRLSVSCPIGRRCMRPVGRARWSRACLGGCADGVLRDASCGHHALPGQAMGFCLFNNVAIAAELAIRELGLRRVFILYWDVHHGNGTADFFRCRSDVLFASIHEGGADPGSGTLADAGLTGTVAIR